MKIKTLILTLPCLGLFAAYSSFGASYDTLPKGVDMLVVKQVLTSRIESKFNAENQDESLSLKENFSSNKLENINNALKSYFQELKSISPEAYNQFSLGEFEAKAYAEVSAKGLGIARGFTDHLTLYGSIPMYHIKTNVDFKQSKKSNLVATQAAVSNTNPTTAVSTFVRQLTLQLPETNEQVLQSLVVNYYGYKPLGKWEKEALGDAEIGGIYRFTDFSDRGFALALGAVLPTGDADDPDSLQDVSTGDGQYDAFVESMSGISFLDNLINLDLKTRITYQFARKKSMRTLDDINVPLSKNKELMSEKLGNKIDATITATLNPVAWFNVNTSLIFNEVGVSTYGASSEKVKEVLEQNTASSAHWVKLGLGFSTVELYKSKKLDVPCEINLSAQKLLNAKNSAKYERFDLDFRLYF